MIITIHLNYLHYFKYPTDKLIKYGILKDPPLYLNSAQIFFLWEMSK